ncbi:uncharacterized protein LOC144432098 isoform X1 [Styela clava]
MFSFRKPTCPNVYDWESLQKIPYPQECGRLICLKCIPPPNGIEKLKSVLAEAKLASVILQRCFPKADQMLEILQAILKNKNLKKIALDLRLNEYNDECVNIVAHLIKREVVRSFECPDNMDAVNTETLLLEAITTIDKFQMSVLNLNGALLNEHSLKYIEEILLKRIISDKLIMTNCKRTCDAFLTSENYELLKKAAENGQRWYRPNLKIEWFPYVGQICEIEYRGFDLLFNSTREYFFNRETGKKDSVVRQVLKWKNEMPWQVRKLGSKHRRTSIQDENNETVGKRQKTAIESSVDEITDRFNLEVDVGRNLATNKIDGATGNVARYFDSNLSSSPIDCPSSSQVGIKATNEYTRPYSSYPIDCPTSSQVGIKATNEYTRPYSSSLIDCPTSSQIGIKASNEHTRSERKNRNIVKKKKHGKISQSKVSGQI